MTIKVAIVGSQGRHWTPVQRTKVINRIQEILKSHYEIETVFGGPEYGIWTRVNLPILISGGCGAEGEKKKQKFDGGVDVWAEIVADVLGVKKEIYYAPSMQWGDKTVHIVHSVHPEDPNAWTEKVNLKGFETRNMEIAKSCDVLYCIDPATRRSGGRWTLEYAEKLGKEVHLVLIE